jgi:hypothetical protein
MALGGRKFLISLVVMAAACAVDILTERGLSVNLAGLLGAILASFSVSNVAATMSYNRSKQQAAPAADNPEIRYIADKLDDTSKLIEQVAVAVGQTQQVILTVAKASAEQRK